MDDYLYVRKGLLVVIITQFCRSISSFSSIFWLCSLQRYTVWRKSVSPLTLIVFGAQQATVFSWNALKTDRTLPAQHQTTNWLVARYFPQELIEFKTELKRKVNVQLAFIRWAERDSKWMWCVYSLFSLPPNGQKKCHRFKFKYCLIVYASPHSANWVYQVIRRYYIKVVFF